MRKECEASLKPSQAALIVRYGNTTRKFHPLDADLVVLGRAPSCDITVVSHEVAPIHCILRRDRDGWRLRDCSGGRNATRLNGRQIHEEALRDTDVLQIGAFSFEMRLPSARVTPVVGSTPVVDDRMAARLKHLRRSRSNLVRLALLLRRRVRKANPLPPTLAELERQAQCLRDLQRDYETRVNEQQARLSELEKAERELCDERETFERECLERRIQLEQAEQDLAHRQAAPAAERDRARQANVRERLAELSHLKQEIAGSSPSAPGERLRADIAMVMDPVQ